MPKNWLLLDSGSTISSVCNKDLLHNIVQVSEPVLLFTNGGSQDYSERGTLIINFEAYFNPKSMTNILSLSEISDICCITMDTSSSPSITVHLDDDKCLVFSKFCSGLYYYDIDSGLGTASKPKENITNYTLF